MTNQDELAISKNWEGKLPVFRLFKNKASGNGAFGDNHVHAACMVRLNVEG